MLHDLYNVPWINHFYCSQGVFSNLSHPVQTDNLVPRVGETSTLVLRGSTLVLRGSTEE